MHGPGQRGVDANSEILEIVADVVASPTVFSYRDLLDHLGAYTPAQLAEALLVAVERVAIYRCPR